MAASIERRGSPLQVVQVADGPRAVEIGVGEVDEIQERPAVGDALLPEGDALGGRQQAQAPAAIQQRRGGGAIHRRHDVRRRGGSPHREASERQHDPQRGGGTDQAVRQTPWVAAAESNRCHLSSPAGPATAGDGRRWHRSIKRQPQFGRPTYGKWERKTLSLPMQSVSGVFATTLRATSITSSDRARPFSAPKFAGWDVS